MISASKITESVKEQSRPGARRAILILTDNNAAKAVADYVVRNELWENDVVLNALLFRTSFRSGQADVRPFVEATGGDSMWYKSGKFPLADMFQRMRQRYVLVYRSPGGEPGQVRLIKVEVSKPGSKDLTVRARTGYLAGVSGSTCVVRSAGKLVRP